MTVEIVPEALRHSPLAGERHGDPGTVELVEVPYSVMVDLRLDVTDAATLTAVTDVLGVQIATAVGESSSNADSSLRVLCLGPDWWLVTAPASATGLPSKLAAVTGGQPWASAVDVSAGRTRIELRGPRVDDVLRHLWEQDLRQLTVGRCAQGMLVRASVMMVREDTDRVAVLVRASFARYAWAMLTDAATEYLPEA